MTKGLPGRAVPHQRHAAPWARGEAESVTEGGDPLEALTEEAILEVIRDFCFRGKEAFFEHHGIRKRAETWFIHHAGRDYDLKAIARAALDIPQGRIRSTRQVASKIKSLKSPKFSVVTRPKPTPDHADPDKGRTI